MRCDGMVLVPRAFQPWQQVHSAGLRAAVVGIPAARRKRGLSLPFQVKLKKARKTQPHDCRVANKRVDVDDGFIIVCFVRRAVGWDVHGWRKAAAWLENDKKHQPQQPREAPRVALEGQVGYMVGDFKLWPVRPSHRGERTVEQQGAVARAVAGTAGNVCGLGQRSLAPRAMTPCPTLFKP